MCEALHLGYSDLVWMGGCAAQTSKTILIYKDQFGRKCFAFLGIFLKL